MYTHSKTEISDKSMSPQFGIMGHVRYAAFVVIDPAATASAPGRAGVALIRDGRSIAHVITVMN